jgi:dihydroflavonol-4-reductase
MSDQIEGPILVTGGSGFLAQHTILQLLQRGHGIRTTVRSQSKAEAVRAVLERAGADTARLEIVEANLMYKPSWAAAMHGIGAVLHMATPMAGKQVLAAALDGTRHVIEAAADAGINRIVVTSSGLAVSQARSGSFDETDWADVSSRATPAYTRAKTEAERLAWNLAKSRRLSLTTILPGAILGPALGSDRSGWIGLVDTMLKGKMALLPPVAMQFVDVRDLADLHIRTLFSPEAIGQRYIAMGSARRFSEIAALLTEVAPASKISTREMPSWMLRLLGLAVPDTRTLVSMLGNTATLRADKAARELEWRTRPVDESVLDTARSLV